MGGWPWLWRLCSPLSRTAVWAASPAPAPAPPPPTAPRASHTPKHPPPEHTNTPGTTHGYLCIYLWMTMSMSMCVYISMYLCMFVSLYICIYVSMSMSSVCSRGTYAKRCMHIYEYFVICTLRWNQIKRQRVSIYRWTKKIVMDGWGCGYLSLVHILSVCFEVQNPKT